jgi:hypothetical protein
MPRCLPPDASRCSRCSRCPEFERAYRDTDSPAYRKMVAAIDRRIGKLGLFSAGSLP